jgi:prepilin signal peptidase PulO-like enzyme (type II secretory pathway)
MTGLIGLIVFIFGLNIGSFLNVVIWRLHTEESLVVKRSYCPKCKHQLKIIDLIPLISFLMLRGHCRQCREPISWQYPIVELATATIFTGLFLRFGLGDQFVVYAIYTAFLLVTFVFDLKHYLILDRVMIPAGIVAIIGGWVLGLSWQSLLIGAAVGGGFFLLQYVISQGRWIGGGDIRLGAVMGLMLGWQVTVMALFISYLVGSLGGVGLIAFRKKTWSSRLPFGVFLTVGSVICFFWGNQLVDYYVSLTR